MHRTTVPLKLGLSGMQKIANRSAVLLLVVLGCAPSWEVAVQDYQVGRYNAAEEALAYYAENGEGARRGEAESLLRSLRDERGRAVEFLLAEARHIRKSADAQAMSYRAVDSFLGAALELMANDDPRRDGVKKEREELETLAQSRIEEYAEGVEVFGRVVSSAGRCRGAEWLERARQLSTAREGAGVREADDLLVVHTAVAAGKCFEFRAYESAVALSELADAIRDPASASSPTVARLSAVAQARMWTDEPILARNAQEDLTEEQVEILAEAPVNKSIAASRPRRRRRRPPRRSTPVAPEPDVTAGADEEPEPTGPSKDVLERQVTDLFRMGKKYDAFVELEQLIGQYPDMGLQSLRVRWASDRNKLVQDLLSQGETALQAEQPEDALGFYETVLRIDPKNDVALDRKRKIDKLFELRRKRETKKRRRRKK
ncbi:MAG: hypothetical protein AAF658_00310 [Myxococcota bacterium]